VDIVDVNTLLTERYTPTNFEGTTSLKAFLKEKDWIIKILKDDHHIASSHSELIVMTRHLL
jgi:hypothetical protein